MTTQERWGAPGGILLAITVVTVAAVVAGWRAFLFLTDDAYIEFRYVSNAVAGHGLVWNPPPFEAVEGYTSLLWVLLLQLVWVTTGIEPPDAANPLSLLFGLGTLFMTYRLVEAIALPPHLERHRLAFLVFVLCGTITNRTFLTWLSSGLETALFNFCLTFWVCEVVRGAGRRDTGWLGRAAVAATLAALARPDGLLCVGATVVILGLHARRDLAVLRYGIPLLLVPVHFVWRRVTYGFWLPNTYYAKHVEPWPESGVRYLASFVVEYGLWVWVALGVAAAWRGLPRAPRDARGPDLVVSSIPAAVVAAHAGYYTFVVGGDHFEYRVYSGLVPLLFVAAVWFAARLRSVWAAYAWLLGFFLAGLPVQWVHWAETRALATRGETHVLVRPIAHRFPEPLRGAVRRFDSWQDWLIRHHVGMRHQEHKVFHEYCHAIVPTREQGSKIAWSQRAVLYSQTVGVAGWVLPHVAVIDRYGLTDRVIAHNPIDARRAEYRLMAHDRVPPPGYVECFRPNVTIAGRVATVAERAAPLSDADIRACSRWPPAR